MRKLILLALLSFCQLAFADWSRIAEKSHPEPQQYIDLDSVKQTGPMAIMRRVWELRNFSKPVNGGVRSIKRLSGLKARVWRPVEKTRPNPPGVRSKPKASTRLSSKKCARTRMTVETS